MNTPAPEVKKKKAVPLVSDYEVYEAETVIPFAVKRKGVVKWYCIGHMSGTNRDKYFAEVQKHAPQLNEDGSPVIATGSFDGMSTMLLQYCVYGFNKKENEDSGESDGILVGVDVIAEWETPLLDKLVNKANQLNGMDDDSAVAVGNDS